MSNLNKDVSLWTAIDVKNGKIGNNVPLHFSFDHWCILHIEIKHPLSNVATFPDLSNDSVKYNVIITNRNNGQL